MMNAVMSLQSRVTLTHYEVQCHHTGALSQVMWPLLSERFDPQGKSFLSPLFFIAFLLKMKKAGMVAPANNPSTGKIEHLRPAT